MTPNEPPNPLAETLNEMLSCIDKIEGNLQNLEELHDNDGLPEAVDTEEVTRWEKRTEAALNESSGKLKDV